MTDGLADLIAALERIAKPEYGIGFNKLRSIARQALAAHRLSLTSDGAWTPSHRHVKRGTTYQYIDDADLQTDKPISDYEVVSVYRGEDGRLWVRPKSEFSDGRFEAIPEPDVATPSTPGNGVDAELSNAAACRLSRAFNQVADLRDPDDRRINEWLKRLIASTQLFRRDDEDPAEYQVALDRAKAENDGLVDAELREALSEMLECYEDVWDHAPDGPGESAYQSNRAKRAVELSRSALALNHPANPDAELRAMSEAELASIAVLEDMATWEHTSYMEVAIADLRVLIAQRDRLREQLREGEGEGK